MRKAVLRTIPDLRFASFGMTASETDRRFMAAALRLGARELGLTSPNPAVGALVVRLDDGAPTIVGQGATQPPGGPHAERTALAQAGEAARGAALYVSLEPCSHHGRTPPCVDAILGAGVTRVITALEDPNPAVAGGGHARLREAGVEVVTGVLAEEARRVHSGHLNLVGEGLPHVTLKLAVSRDGKIAGSGRTRIAVTGEAALAQSQMLRVTADAIVVGIGTVLADDPWLTVRLPGLEARSPLRVVLDAELRLPLASRLLETARLVPLLVVTGQGAPAERADALRAGGAEILQVPAGPKSLDLAATLRALAARGIARVLVEGGSRIAASFVRENLVGEIVLFEAPDALGPDALDALEGLELASLTASSTYALTHDGAAARDRVRVYWRV